MPRMITVDADIIQNGLKAIEKSLDIALGQGYLTSEDARIILRDDSLCQGDTTLGLFRDGQLSADHLDDQPLAALGRECSEKGKPRSLLWLLNHLTLAEWGIRQLRVE